MSRSHLWAKRVDSLVSWAKWFSDSLKRTRIPIPWLASPMASFILKRFDISQFVSESLLQSHLGGKRVDSYWCAEPSWFTDSLKRTGIPILRLVPTLLFTPQKKILLEISQNFIFRKAKVQEFSFKTRCQRVIGLAKVSTLIGKLNHMIHWLTKQN